MNGLLLLGAALFAVLIVLDLAGKLNLMRPWFLAFYIPVAINLPLLYTAYFTHAEGGAGAIWALYIAYSLELFYVWVRLMVFPVRDGKRVGFRLKTMIGGKPILYAHIYGILFELVFYLACWGRLRAAGYAHPMLALNAIYALCCCAVLFANGILRVFCTSKRLSILRRVLILMVLWVPVVNWVLWFYTARLVQDEYDFAYEKKQLAATRVESDLCRTRYPLVLVHGIAFRDFRYFNYWGRIPRELIRNGATIYYGNQEALGRTEYNAEDIRRCIERVMEETGCDKVNIIAHSKGGLDSRYAVSALGMAEHVASLTTINTPHRGCKFVDTATKMPEKLYRFIAKCFDDTFRKFGDKNPDFYAATKAFCTAPSAEFNDKVKDAPGVYYQSYMSVMKGFFSDSLLCIPYFFIKRCGEPDNDGLVSTDSAKWGEFRSVIRNRYRRGISHGDIIDLKREDYKGFDVRETYVQIVSELREKGF